jgi:TolB-like protein/DNA-binding winged helix-turn-helix (wHTH) protein/Flp pilus assembly protein TadD
MTRDLPPLARHEPVRLSAERDFVLDDLEIRPSLSEAIRGTRSQHVEPRVMQVLVALAGAGGAVVSREELVRRCWDGRVVGEAAINRCMSRLRALADRGDGTRSFQVETIARIGYRLKAGIGEVEPAATPGAPLREPRRKRVALLAFAGLAMAAVAAFAVYRGVASRVTTTGASSAAEPSIAVLPFKDLSADADAAYFAAAIQDEILTRLAKIGSLKVISRTSAVEAASKPGTLADIARTLGVANVLEGSVQRAGDTVRVNVQLIRAASDDHLWAEAYERPLDDVLSVENDIAGSIVTVLAAKITPGESLALSAKPTTNGKAYDLYLHALVWYRLNQAAGVDDAVGALEQAVVLDPEFALAWALLARVRANLAFGDAALGETTRQALDRAMALAPDLAEVQIAHAQYKHYVERDYEGAESELRTLHARWPNNIEVLQSLAFVARRLGHWQEALAYFRQAAALDPLSRNNLAVIVETLVYAHRPAEAAKVVTGMRAIWASDPDVIICEADKLQALGELDRADAGLRLLPASADTNGDTLTQRRAQYAYRRQFAEGLAWFEALRASSPVRAWDPLRRAQLELSIGDFRRWSGDAVGARENYQAAADALREPADSIHAEPDALMLSAIAYAGIGDRQSAMRYASRLTGGPLAADAMNGAIGKESMARTLARLDDRDAAIAALARVVKEPSEMTPQRLRLEPDFDKLRADPRFEQLIAANELPVE